MTINNIGFIILLELFVFSQKPLLKIVDYDKKKYKF